MWYPPHHSCESGIPHTIPAKAGIQSGVVSLWIPAFAGMATVVYRYGFRVKPGMAMVESVRIFCG